MAVPNAGRRPGSSASKHTVRPPSEVSKGGDRFLLLDRRFELGGPDDSEHRGAHRESGRRTACVLARKEPIGIAAHERLHRGIRRVRALHDRPTVLARPAHRLHPDRQRAFARGKPRARGREVGIEHRDEVQGTDAEVPHGLGPADHDLARRPRQPRARDASDRHRGYATHPFLDPFGSAPSDPEGRRAARAATPGSLADHTPHRTGRSPKHAAARGARRRGAAGAADLRHAVARNRRVDEGALRLPEGAHQPRRTPFGAGADHLHLRPPPLDGRHHGERDRRGLTRGTGRREHAHRAGQLRPADRDIPGVVVGRALFSMPGV